MPKKYIHTTRGKTLNYTQEQLERAVDAVEKGTLSIRKASEAFSVPRSTIGDRISGKHSLDVVHGRPPHIPKTVEDKIVNAVKMSARRGMGLTRKQILLKTNILCKKVKVQGGYPDFVAGKDWWEGVKRRHPDLALRKPEKLTSTRARMMNPQVIHKYFDDLTTLVEGLSIGEKPWCIWNCDEVGKNFEHAPVRVVAERGQHCVSRTSAKSTNITIMACVNAAGRSMPPMFVVKGKTTRSLHGFKTMDAPADSRWAFQANGWMDDALGEIWFNDVFLQNCGPERPQLLILDGHSSHETLGMLMRAMEENVHILALPPHTTHFLQPLDCAVFGPLNRIYNEVCSSFLQENAVHTVCKWTFPMLFSQAWERALTSSNIKSGFRRCGIYPIDRNAIPAKAYGPSEPTDRLLEIPPVPSQTHPEESIGSMASKTAVTGLRSADTDPFLPVVSSPDESASELPAASASSVLDISDPEQLFSLIASGEASMDPLVDESGAPVIIEPHATSETDENIQTLFSSQPPSGARKHSRNNKRITHHRLLTSEDILSEKVQLEMVKKEKENKKKERSIKKEK